MCRAHGIMSLAQDSVHGIMSLTYFLALGGISRESAPWLTDILPCAGKFVYDIML